MAELMNLFIIQISDGDIIAEYMNIINGNIVIYQLLLHLVIALVFPLIIH